MLSPSLCIQRSQCNPNPIEPLSAPAAAPPIKSMSRFLPPAAAPPHCLCHSTQTVATQAKRTGPIKGPRLTQKSFQHIVIRGEKKTGLRGNFSQNFQVCLSCGHSHYLITRNFLFAKIVLWC